MKTVGIFVVKFYKLKLNIITYSSQDYVITGSIIYVSTCRVKYPKESRMLAGFQELFISVRRSLMSSVSLSILKCAHLRLYLYLNIIYYL
jgi:hypothetical protein